MPVKRNVSDTRFCSWKCQKNKPVGLSTFWTHAITLPLDLLHTILISALLNLLELKRNVLLRTVIKVKRVKWSLYRPGVVQRVDRGIALLFHDRGTRRGWVVSSTPRPHFTPGKDPVPILQEAGWAPGPVWTGGKSRPHRNSIPDRPAQSSVAISTELPGPILRTVIWVWNPL